MSIQERSRIDLAAISHIRTIRHSINTTQRHLAHSNRDEYWNIIHSPISSYDQEFAELLGKGVSIQTLIDEKKREKPLVKVADLMSYGFALDSIYNIDGGLSVGLTNNNGDVKESERHTFLEGDLLNARTWSGMRQWLQDRFPDDPSFDFILARPVGGFSNFPLSEMQIYRLLMRRTYRLLSSDHGTALIQLPDQLCPYGHNMPTSWKNGINNQIPLTEEFAHYLDPYARLMYEWFQSINATPGLSVRIGLNVKKRFSMKITKNEGAPLLMPELPIFINAFT